ncbi:amino acid transporter AVT1I-like [Cornus florida]|uniref:amino acid transporter AVT1I-like n=1 Tax=Cornus florida TaxID=4283 RepID=UPI0028993FD2|nr:amino acid transporter AVT1I-like [Cornus florida]
MEAKNQDGYSITIPLLCDEDGVKLGHNEQIAQNHNTGTTSFFKTFFNGLNALSGVGILSVPYALSSGGWLSLIFLFAIAFATFYTGLLIKKCMDVDPNIRSYPDIGERAFGSKGRLIVSIFMNTELYLVATGFLILEGDNLHNILPDMGFEIGGIQIGGKQSFVMIVGLIVLPTVWLNNMNILSYISASGVLASIIILGSILWIGAFDGIGFKEKGTTLNLKGLPTAISLYAFCYCAHPVFPTLYTSMKNKQQFSKVLLLCFVFCTISYTSMAVIGYGMFGSEVQSQITLDLPIEKLSSRVAIYTTLINPISKFALMVTPLVNAAENQFRNYCQKRSFSFLIKTTLVISTIVVALAVPFFGYLMSLVGAFLSVTASILLPCLCYLKIYRIYRSPGFELVVILCIILLGVSTAIIGTYTSLVEIIGHL